MFAGDLREKLTIANLLSATMDAFDRVDILVNASRQMAPSDPLIPDEDAVEELLQQNLHDQPAHVADDGQADDRAGREGRGEPGTPIGAIVNLSSIAATRDAARAAGLFHCQRRAGPDDPLAGRGAGAQGHPGECGGLRQRDERQPARAR